MRLSLADGLLFVTMKLLKALDRRESGIEDLDTDAIKNILVVSSTAIGDTLLSTPAIKAVRARYPKAKIIAHLNIANMKLFQNNPHINGIIPYYGGYKKFFKTIRAFRKEDLDLALIFHGNEPQATPMAYLSGARFIIKLPNTSEYRFLLSNSKEITRPEAFGHGVEQRLKVAELAGCVITDKKMTLPILNDGDTFIKKFLRDNSINDADTLIGFQPGASTISRMWFAERFIELGKRLIKSHPELKIAITGSPKEYALCRKIADAIGENVVVSSGRIPLKYLPSLVECMKLLVTGDTGIMHLAAAVETPVIALFAVSDPERSGPYYGLDKHIVIRKERTCDPCISKKCRYQKCMENISVDEVYDAVLGIVDRHKAKES
ncbi:MAG: glycosyltransferase family 9 protein [Nitrospirae bacterium]|nr:glycosyltransferase family 9 protein [Nitrospirota bacterium]